jgi:hypothetical protein
MNHAVMQTGANAPELEQLRRAFQGVPGLTGLDAMAFGLVPFGMLARGLELEQATALKSALAVQGVEAELARETDLPKLPEAHFVDRVDGTEDALLLFDVLERKFSIPWDDVLLIAAGRVLTVEFKRVGRPVGSAINVSDSFWQADLSIGGFQGGPAISARQYETQEATKPQLLLEIVPAGGAVRYSVNVNKCAVQLFRYLAERRTPNILSNFTLLVEDLALGAPQATLNRGAYYLTKTKDGVATYSSKTAFYNEIVWVLWFQGFNPQT